MAGRRWITLLSFGMVLGMVLGLAAPASAAFSVDYFYVQHRLYESGAELNKVAFGIKDGQGNYVTVNKLKAVTITDPNGQVLPLTKDSFKFAAYLSWDGEYDGRSGIFGYGEGFYKSSGYAATLPDALIPGTYHLKAKYGTGLCQADFTFNQQILLPVVPASSIDVSVDKAGNLTSQWDVPMSLCKTSPALPTSVRTWIDVYQGGVLKAELYVRIPSHMGRLFVPKAIVKKLIAQGGDKVTTMIQLRTNDNNNRSYTYERVISLTSGNRELDYDEGGDGEGTDNR